MQSSHPPIKSLTKKCPGQGKCGSCSPKGPAGIQFFLSPAFLLPYNLKKGIKKPTELSKSNVLLLRGAHPFILHFG